MSAKSQFWGEVTSTLDWCERNYQFSTYVAELTNTISNVATITLGLHGCRKALAQSLPTRYVASFVGLCLVGIGSSLFHATLLYEAQLTDELPIYVTTQNLYILLETVPGASKDSSRRRPLIITLATFNLVFTLIYSIYRNPLLHQTVFAILMLAVAGRASFLSRHSSSPLSTKKRREISALLWLGSWTFIFGFVIWNLDNVYCDTIKQWKTNIGFPAAFLLEGHAWWHIFSATGSYLLMVGVQYLTLCVKKGQENFEIAYEMHMPYVLRRLSREN